MRIVVIGGLPSSLINFRGPLLETLVQLGHEVYACAPSASLEVKKRLKEMGVHYENVPVARAGLNPFADLATIACLHRLFRRIQPDRILAYTAKPVVYSSLAARWAGYGNVYAMITGLGYGFGAVSYRQRAIGSLVRLLYRVSLKRVKKVFFQNPDDLKLFLREGLVSSSKPTTIINGSGVDLAQFSPRPLPLQPVFLLVARLLVDKGVREYIQAARRIKKRYPEARFLLVGASDPNPMSIREEEIAGWVEEGTVKYLGRMDDVRPAYAEAQVYVLPSYREGTPRTVLEAMAMGRPVITTDAPGCRETVVEGVNGFLVPIKDHVMLAEAMERFIIDLDLAERMGAESLRIAQEKYDVNKVNAAILNALGIQGKD